VVWGADRFPRRLLPCLKDKRGFKTLYDTSIDSARCLNRVPRLRDNIRFSESFGRDSRRFRESLSESAGAREGLHFRAFEGP
jgi:hypothetical protein